jgi:hypothetical protein
MFDIKAGRVSCVTYVPYYHRHTIPSPKSRPGFGYDIRTPYPLTYVAYGQKPAGFCSNHTYDRYGIIKFK